MSRPSDLRYTINDVERTRTNAQVTLQFRPMDRLTGTVDYFYEESEIADHRSEQSLWYLQDSIDHTVPGNALSSDLLVQAFGAGVQGGR